MYVSRLDFFTVEQENRLLGIGTIAGNRTCQEQEGDQRFLGHIQSYEMPACAGL
jgi:hypothetical protein